MKQYITAALAAALTLAAAPAAQAADSQQARKTATAQKTAKKPAAKKPAAKKPAAKKTAAKGRKATAKKAAVYTTEEIRGLQSKRSAVQKEIKKQEAALRANQADVKKRLGDLMVINSEIDRHQKNIDGIQKDIHHIDGNIGMLNAQLSTLQQQLKDRKAKYVKSMRYMTRQHSLQDRLMFIFSAKNLAQMYRRLRFVREYASWQKAQGEMVKAKQTQVNEKHQQLQQVKGQKSTMLYKGQQERLALEGKQQEQQTVVTSLQKQQKTIQKVISQQRKDADAINAQIDRLIAIEVEKARVRAAEEAKRRAAAEAAAKKRREEELARKKAEAEKARLENERRLREARQAEARAKAEARAAQEREAAARAEAQRQKDAEAKKKAQAAAQQAAEQAAEQKAAAEQRAREAEAQREAVERKAAADEQRSTREIAAARKDVEESRTMSSVDRMMSGGFEANKGRLPMPITGSYRVVSHYGQNSVAGLSGVTIDNKGINIMGQPGCQARAVYDGEVSAVFGYGGSFVVMVRHGAYISVYCNLRSVGVHRGQKVAARQALGAVAADNILQFQLRKMQSRLNPEAWIGR